MILLLTGASLRGSFQIAEEGRARCIILQQPGATEPEKSAVRELADALQQITTADFKVSEDSTDMHQRAIIVGPGPLTVKFFPELDLTNLGPEELVMRVKGDKLLLAGGRPRGMLYAVNRFLQEQCGVRWWTPWATNVPRQTTLRVPELDVREKPAFEYRAPFWFAGFQPAWKVHNCVNDSFSEIPKVMGGCIKYKGHAHTFYPLVPPDKHFAEHPEWYSLIKGKRTVERGQLCLTNPQLRDFVVGRVKEWLRESPDAEIISVTQNDWQGWCECPDCKALDEAEGSHSGTMLTFVNYIAERIERDFPNVAVDTFAYQYTRKPPKTVRPRKNVIVRLCSIECNFREPLDHASNADFMADLAGWSKMCSRLHIWDYTTDFGNYIHPHPNWFTLGPNVRLFERLGVKGVFEQGAYAGNGAEMAELRSWVLGQLLWNPKQDDQALIKAFLTGYYGAAREPIYQYLALMHRASQGVFLRCFLSKEILPHLNFSTLSEAERLWQQAESAAGGDPEKLIRVRLAHLPVRCALLKSWSRLRRECWEQNGGWPLSPSRKAVAEEFRTVCEGVPGRDWTRVRVMNEHGLTVEDFLKNFAEDPPEKDRSPPPVRLNNPPAPRDLGEINASACVDLQDNIANLYQPGKFAAIRPDPAASDLRAVRMPGDHQEWAFRIEGVKMPTKAQSGKWRVYAIVRVQKLTGCQEDSVIFTAGVYDNNQKKGLADFRAKGRETSDAYHSYLIGTVEMTPDRDIWVAPANNSGVEAIWVDRIFLAPSEQKGPS